MHRSVFLALVGVFSFPGLVAASTTLAVCNANNCLRAVRGTVAPSKSGTVACSSYFLTTLIPPTTTIIATSTIFTTSTDTIEETSTDVIAATTTDIIDVAVTSTIDAVATTTDDVTTTTDLEITITSTSSTSTTTTKSVTLVDRALGSTTTIKPSSIPAFASACSGSVGFSSACSCAGVTASTITMPSPSTTITVPYTYTGSTATVFETDATVTTTSFASTETDYSTTTTDSVTITDSTATFVTTVSTETDTFSTSTTVVDVQTSTATATVTQTCANPLPTFALQVVGGAYNGQYLQSVAFYNQNADLATASTTITALSAYTLTGTVLSEYNGDTLGAPPNVAFTYAEFRTAAYNAAGGDVPFVCAITNGQLTCHLGAATQIGICNISGPVTVLTEPNYYPSGFGCTNVILNVIPLCIVP